MEKNNCEKENINSLKDEYDNMNADKLTYLAETLIFNIPIIILCVRYIIPDFLNYKFIRVLIRIVTLICILSGVTLLVYIRIKYPENLKSKKLVKTCIFTTIAIALICGLVYVTCIRIILNCKGMPG